MCCTGILQIKDKDIRMNAWGIYKMLLLEQMLVLFLIMCVGYYSYRKEIITDEVNQKLSAIVVNWNPVRMCFSFRITF